MIAVLLLVYYDGGARRMKDGRALSSSDGARRQTKHTRATTSTRTKPSNDRTHHFWISKLINGINDDF